MPLPTTATTPDDLETIRNAATRIETPCGDGSLVWHRWGEGAPVVLLHGGSGSWTHWVRNVATLCANNYSVIAPDLPGFGDSALPPDGRDGDVMPRWLELGLQQIIGEQSCAMVGFSFGAMVGTLLAAQFKARVNHLVLVGAPALSDTPIARVRLENWQKIEPGAERDVIHRHNLNALMIADPARTDELAIRLHEANIERDRLRTRRLPRTNIVVRTLPEVQCYVSGIWGEKDAVYQDRISTIEPALKLASQYNGLTLLPGVGHWAQYEAADSFNPILLTALSV